MKTELQSNLLICLQSKMSGEPNVKSDTLTKPKFKNKEISIPSSEISKKMSRALEADYMTDIQMIDRLCALIPVNRKTQTDLSSLRDKNPKECAQRIADIIYNEKTDNINSKEASTDIKNDITEEQTACFYRELNEWVQQAGEGENRIKAQESIILAFETDSYNLNLNFLNLTSLPSAITQLKSLSEIDLLSNKLSEFPECLYFCTLNRINIMYNDIIDLTAGMRMLISEFGCNIIVEKQSISGDPSILFEKLYYFKDILMSDKNIKIGEHDCDAASHIGLVNKDALEPQVEKILIESYHKKMQPKTQDEFLESFDQCDFDNKRTFLTKDGSVNIIGCASSFCDSENTSESNKSLEFIYQNVDTMILLIPRDLEEEKVEFIKNCTGNDQHRLTQVKSLPMLDFSHPRLEHYEIILDTLKNNKSTSKNRPKTIMISCHIGEGRTGTCLSMLKLVDEFKILPESAKKDLDSLDRTHPIAPRHGTFSALDDDYRTTEFIANVIDSIRINEEKSLDHAISVETPEQIMSLELMHLMLIINHIQQEGPLMTDDEILNLIYSKGFSEEFIMTFGDNYFTKPIEGVLTASDMLTESENKILQRIKNIHTII
ncbi:MAG: hypothetical protein QS748_07310 [Candidatus Endonucleobacter bathymodioli]|uniref:Tyrosine specific protein phosphatases domain-containing protein n=1 Tax=Candidatus Endonucleibacter bathymodioli TaxID=539814 RepID=A0AA90NTS1_9GAMM|nr:hypothetical protein [Candidatus Endonucleobacter bathymodioli]